MSKNNNTQNIQFICGNAAPPPAYYEVEHELLQIKYNNNNNNQKTRLVAGSEHVAFYKNKRIIITIIIGILLLCVVPSTVLLAFGNGFNTSYHKYKDLPATTCLGGNNITNIWYSPPYPFNTTFTYAPARATFLTHGYAANGSLISVLGRIPTRYEWIIDSLPCKNCVGSGNTCKCAYRLGDLYKVINKLQNLQNCTCVIDKHGELFSLTSTTAQLNKMYYMQMSGIIIFTFTCTGLVIIIWIAFCRSS